MNALQLAESLSAVLVDAAAKGTVLLAGASLSTLLLRRASAALRHRIWGLTMASLVLLPALSWLLPAWQLPILPPAASPADSTAVVRKVQPANPWQSDSPIDGLPAERLTSAAAMKSEALDPAPAVGSARPPDNALMTQPAISSATTQPPSANWASASVTIIWLAGTSFLLAVVAVGVSRTRRLWHRSQSITDESWGRLIRELCVRLALRRSVQLREHAKPVVPLTCGLLRPFILLPQEARRWSDPMRRAVLLHELAHVCRGDVAYQLLGRIACALYWFHPLAWFGLSRLRHERELACDDAVVAAGERASNYAQQLLEVARRCSGAARLSMAVEMTRGGSLEQRVRALFDAARSHTPVGRRLAVSLIALTVAVASATAILRPVAAEPEPGVNEHPAVADDSESSVLKKAPTKRRTFTNDADHHKRFKLALAHAQRLIAAGKPQDALPSLDEAVHELPLVPHDDLLTDEYRRIGLDAVRIRSVGQVELVAALLAIGKLDEAMTLADGIPSPGIQARALSKIAVKLGALGQREEASLFLDRALTAARKEIKVPEKFAVSWGYKEATWRITALFAVGDAAHILGDVERTAQVVKLMEFARGDKGDAIELLQAIAHRQFDLGDKPGMQQTLQHIAENCPNAEAAAETIAAFWSGIFSKLIVSGRFDEAFSHLDKLADNTRDRARAGLIHGWSRNNQLERATAELQRIKDPQSKSIATIFLARAEASAGKREKAAKLLSAATELVRGDANPYVRLFPLALAIETQALWGDYSAAGQEAKRLQATMPADTYLYADSDGFRFNFFEMPNQLIVGPNTAWLLTARAQLRAGKIDEALRSVEQIVDTTGPWNSVVERDRVYFYSILARELLRTGERDRVQGLLSKEANAAVREAIEIELQATSSE